MVPLRAGETRVYDPERLPIACEQGFCDLADDPLVDVGIADDALRNLGTARLELRVHQHERPPAGRRESERRRQRELDGDEGDVARDELGRERELRDRTAFTRSSTVTRGSSRIFE